MNFRAILYNSATLNAPKNVLLFLFGVVLYFNVFGDYDLLKVIFGTLGLSLGLGPIYLFNDLTDYEEDKKNETKISWKAIANGSISIPTVKILIFVLSILGTLLSFLAGINFFIIFILLITLNLLYSYPSIRLKNHKNISSIIITLIQISKISSGWFLLTNSLKEFPFFIVFALSVGYSLLFIYYKHDTTDIKKITKENKLRVYSLSLMLSSFLLISYFIYSFPVVLIIFLGMAIPTILLYILSKEYLGTKVNFAFMYSGFIIIIVSFLLLSVPIVTATNHTLLEYSEQLKEVLTKVYLSK